MDAVRIVSVIVQDGNGGIEAVSKINNSAKVVPINKTKKSGIYASQYGVFFNILRVIFILRKNDVIMTNLPIHHMVFSFFNLFLRKNLICVEHGPWVHAIGAKSNILISFAYQIWVKYSKNTIVCVSKDLLALYNMLRSNNVYIPNAISETRRGEREPSHIKKFVFAGRFDFQKDTKLAIDSFLEFTARNDSFECSLELYGSGVELEVLKEQYGKYENVHFMGHDTSLRQRLWQYDVCLLTSKFEGLPGIALESLYAGCKVVATPFITGLLELNKSSLMFIADSRKKECVAQTLAEALVCDVDVMDTAKMLEENYSTDKVNSAYAKLFAN